MVEDGAEGLEALSAELFPKTGRATTVGLTGRPGWGSRRSSASWSAPRGRSGRSVAVLAIDPTSPLSGGALLGDRLRMQTHATDPGVFIRSMATRGHLGGMALAAPEAIRVLDAAGHDLVIVETVGVGQAEVDVAAATDTTVVVVSPGWGDAVQVAKAGILEIADVFVVNKADREGLEVAARPRADAADGSRAHVDAARGADHRDRGRRDRGVVGRARVPPGAPEASGELERGRRGRLLREVESLSLAKLRVPRARAPGRRRLARGRPDGAADRSLPDRRYPEERITGGP